MIDGHTALGLNSSNIKRLTFMYKQFLCKSLNKKYLFRMFWGLQDQEKPTQFFREKPLKIKSI